MHQKFYRYITELDVAIKIDRADVDSINSQLVKQAELYEKMMTTYLDQPACRAVQTWGLTGRASWIPYVYPGFGMALPFDRNYEPKPAYFSMQSAMLGTSVWSSSDQCGGGLMGDIIRFFQRIVGMLQELFSSLA